MNNSNSPWQCLDSIPRCSAPADIWKNYLGEQFPLFRAAFLQRGILVRQARATGEHCLQLNWHALGTALCAVFGLDRKSVDLPVPSTRQVGSWSSAAVPVILTNQTKCHLFRHVICELSLRLHTPYILLAPTSRHMNVNCQELLAHARAGFFALSSHVFMTGQGVLRLHESADELFRQFTPQPKEILDEDTTGKAFALLEALESSTTMKHPSATAIFRLYCIDALGVSAIARKCGCSRGTVMNRLAFIRNKTGADPDALRGTSGVFDNADKQVSDSRARYIHRKQLIDDTNEADG